MDYSTFSSLENAGKALKDNRNSKILAGGTDLLVHYRHKKIAPERLLDIKKIELIKGIKFEDNYLTIGACTQLNELAENPIISEKFHIIKESAMYVGCYQIRNRATIGGNICNASPAADTVPPLFCLNAILTYYTDGNYTDVNINNFFTGPGKTIMPDNAILCWIKVPKEYENSHGKYIRHSRRNALDLSTVSVATLKHNNEYTIALGSVAPKVIRVIDAEMLLNKEGLNESTINKASEIAANTCNPISDLRASKEYRKELVKAYTSKALKALMEE